MVRFHNMGDGNPKIQFTAEEETARDLEEANHWKRRLQSVTYNFKSDLDVLLESVDHFDDLFQKNAQYPIILLKLYQEEIQLETFLILNQMLNFFPQFDKELDEYQWPVTRKLCNKYGSFLNVDLEKYSQIVKKELDI